MLINTCIAYFNASWIEWQQMSAALKRLQLLTATASVSKRFNENTANGAFVMKRHHSL